MRVFGTLYAKIKGTRCIFGTVGVPHEFRKTSGVPGEKSNLFTFCLIEFWVRLEYNMLYHNLLCNMYNDINSNKNDMNCTNNGMNLMSLCFLFDIIWVLFTNGFFTKCPRVFMKFTGYPSVSTKYTRIPLMTNGVNCR